MPIKAGWYDKGHTIRYWQFIEDWDWQEFSRMVTEHSPEPESKPYAIATIVDLTRSYARPKNAFEMFKTAEHRAASNVSIYVVVGNAVMRGMVSVYSQIHHNPKRSVVPAETVEEALQIIREHRAANDAIDGK